MFGWFREAAVAPVAEVAKPMSRPRQNPVQSAGAPDELATYVALCKEIDAETPAVRMLQLREFLAQRGIPEYDPVQVHEYLLSLAKAKRTQDNSSATMHILWCPLREKDRQIRFDWVAWGHLLAQDVSVARNDAVYNQLVPASVLATVQTILKAFPDANFFVSEITEIADPFLGVTFPGQMLTIVDFWDEPGFRPVTK